MEQTTTKTFHLQWNFTAYKCFYSETLLTISVFINGCCPSLFPHLMNGHCRWQWNFYGQTIFAKRNAIVFIKQWIYRLICLITETLFQKALKYACTSESYISCVVGDFHSHCNFPHDLLCVDYLIAWQGNYTALCLYSRMHTFTASTLQNSRRWLCAQSHWPVLLALSIENEDHNSDLWLKVALCFEVSCNFPCWLCLQEEPVLQVNRNSVLLDNFYR